MKLDSHYVPVYRHQEFQFPLLDAAHCGTESEHQVSNGSLIGLFSLLILSPFTQILNIVPNNNIIRVKETKIWLPFKTWCSLSVPRCAAYHKGNRNSWCLYWTAPFLGRWSLYEFAHQSLPGQVAQKSSRPTLCLAKPELCRPKIIIM